tara:strand:+ start:64 stop:378 length:315 start_codon:yes stop_codon:yes gene_type:complete
MIIRYLDYENSESIYGIKNMEFLSEQEKYKLIPEFISDLDINAVFVNIKDGFLKQNNEIFRLWEPNEITENIVKKNLSLKKHGVDLNNLKNLNYIIIQTIFTLV